MVGQRDVVRSSLAATAGDRRKRVKLDTATHNNNNNNLNTQLNQLLARSIPVRPPPAATAIRQLKDDLDTVLPVGDVFSARVGRAAARSDLASGGGAVVCVRGGLVAVAGSFVAGLAVDVDDAAGLGVDVALEMHSDMFREKDYKYFRYHDKRWAFLKGVRKALEKSNKYADFSLAQFKRAGALEQGECIGNNPLRPVLTFKLTTSAISGVDNIRFRILPVIAADVFEPKRFAYGKRNAALATAPQHPLHTFYNSSVAGDMLLLEDLQYLHHAASKFPLFRETNALLRLWAHRTGICRTRIAHLQDDGVTAFALTALLAKLVTHGTISPRATYIQAFRAVMTFIQSGKLKSNPGHPVPVYLALHESPELNLFEAVSSGRLHLLEAQCKHALSTLDNHRDTGDQYAGYPAAQESPCHTRRRVVRLLEQALNTRVHSVASFAVSNERFVVGLKLVASEVSRRVDMCHSPSDEEDFVEFWGDKAKIRQFKLGGICQSVLWEESKSESIVQEIIRYAIGINMPELVEGSAEAMAIWCAPEKRLLKNRRALYDNGGKLTTSSCEKFGPLLREAARQLPLSVDSVFMQSPVLRYTALGVTDRKRKTREPILVHCSLERSSDWPEEQTPRDAAMVGFLLELSNGLLEKGVEVECTRDALDVLYEGVPFRVILYVGQLPGYVEADTHELIRRVCLQVGGSTAAFSVAARLAKRWIAAQHLSGHADDIMVELILCTAFIQVVPPATAFAGFLAFLRTIAEFPWTKAPLCVALLEDNEVATQFIVDATRQFEGGRSGDNAVAIFIPKPGNEKVARRVSGRLPERTVMKRLVATAQAALAHLEGSLIQGSRPSSAFKQLFRIAKGTFDVVLELDPGVVGHDDCAIDLCPESPVNTGLSLSKKWSLHLSKLLVGIEPISMYVETLRAELNDATIVFYDKLGGRQIGLVWRPSWTQSRPLTLRGMPLSRPGSPSPDDEPCLIVKDKEQAIWRACQLGHQLITRVITA